MLPVMLRMNQETLAGVCSWLQYEGMIQLTMLYVHSDTVNK